MIKRLTADLISQAPQYLNPLREREIDLRGNKIAVIENLGATQDQFNSIDLSDNEIQKLENFPLLPKLKMLLLSNNRVARIAPGLGEHIPNIDTLILSNNKIESLSELDNLESFKKLKMLSLLGNPVTQKPNYRLHLIAKLPGLKVIDFRKVKPREKAEARQVFGVGKKGAQVTTSILLSSLSALTLLTLHDAPYSQKKRQSPRSLCQVSPPRPSCRRRRPSRPNRSGLPSRTRRRLKRCRRSSARCKMVSCRR
jgi:Leucine-rich repeat (LRR) protein